MPEWEKADQQVTLHGGNKVKTVCVTSCMLFINEQRIPSINN